MHSFDDEELSPVTAGPANKRQPLSHQVADSLRHQIDAGEYRPGDRLPGESTLMEQHGVSRTTVRAALAILRTEGLIESRRGAGVFVRRAKTVAIPVDDPERAASILHSRVAPEIFTALVEALRIAQGGRL